MRKILKSQLFQNTAWLVSGNGLMAGVSFLSSIFVVRNLGPSEYGILQEMTAYFVVILNFENMVNPNLYKKELLEKPDESDDLVLTVGFAIGMAGLVLTLGALALYFILGLHTKFLLLVILLSGMIFRFSNGIAYYFDAHLQSIRGQVSLNLGNCIASGYKVLMSFLNPTAIMQAIAVPIQYSSTALIHIFQYRMRANKGPGAHLQFKKVALLVTATLPLFLSSFVDLFKDRFPIMFLGQISTPQDLGFFGAGAKLTEPWLFVVSALTTSFWPKLVLTKKASPEQYHDATTLFFSTVFYLFSAMAIVGYLSSGFLIHNVLGAKYSGSLGVFQIQTIALLMQALSATFAIVEINEGLMNISLVRNIISVLISFIALSTLVPKYGIIGGSMAVLVTNFASCLILPLMFKKTRWIWLCLVKSPLKGSQLILQRLKG